MGCWGVISPSLWYDSLSVSLPTIAIAGRFHPTNVGAETSIREFSGHTFSKIRTYVSRGGHPKDLGAHPLDKWLGNTLYLETIEKLALHPTVNLGMGGSQESR